MFRSNRVPSQNRSDWHCIVQSERFMIREKIDPRYNAAIAVYFQLIRQPFISATAISFTFVPVGPVIISPPIALSA